MNTFTQKFVALGMLVVSGLAVADSKQVATVVRAVLTEAQSASPDYLKIEGLFPSSLEAGDYEVVAKTLMLYKLDLEEIGDKGVGVKWGAIHHAIHTLGDIPNGGESIIRLWEDKGLLWDGAASLELCDAAVRRGKEMLLLLEKVSRRKDAAKRCMEHIRNGDKTAF